MDENKNIDKMPEDKTFTKEEVKSLLKARVERTHQAFFNRYGVKDLKELDDVVDTGLRCKRNQELRNPDAQANKFEPEFTLDELIGLDAIKNKIKRVAALCVKNSSLDFKQSMNYVFMGNPGTGKTAAARALTQVLYDKHVIKQKKCIEVDRTSLLGEYVGQTSPKVKAAFESALGGVLFIDEAYALKDNYKNDYGTEALTMLNKLMEDYRGQLVVILAGYKNEMLDMLKSNRGLRSRINAYFEFEDYSNEELLKILPLVAKKYKYTIKDDAAEKMIKIISAKRIRNDYASAREVRNLFEAIMEFHAVRTEFEPWDRRITLEDVLNWQIENNVAIKSDMYDA